MISISGGDPTVSGNVTARLKGGKVVVTAPLIQAQGSASISIPSDTSFEDLGAGSRIDVGPTQTVLSSHRTAVYTVGGKQGGKPTSIGHTKTGRPVRDALTDPKTKKDAPNVVAPWYSMPSPLNQAVNQVPLLFMDRAEQSFPLTQGSGTISEIRGADQFITSFAAKPASGGLHHLKMFSWGIPWNTPVDASGKGTGGTITPSDTEDIPPTLDGPIAGEVAQTWVAFRTTDEAMKQSAAVLLRYLGPAKAFDPAAYATIVDAIRRKDPQFTITVTPRITDSPLYDSVRISVVSGGREVGRSLGNLGEEESGTMQFGPVFLIDPGDITDVSSIFIEIVKSRIFGDVRATAQIFYPFAAGSTAVTVGEGRYDLTSSLE